jgi:hypothetical protein
MQGVQVGDKHKNRLQKKTVFLQHLQCLRFCLISRFSCMKKEITSFNVSTRQ